MAATLTPPPTPSGVNIIEGPAPKPPPAPTTEIHVAGIPSSGTEQPPPKKGSSMQRTFDALRKKAKNVHDARDPDEPTPPVTSPKAKAQPEETTSPETPEPEVQTPPEGTEEKPAEGTEAKPAAAPTEKKKVNPWKLVDEYKAKLSKAEEEVAKAKTGSLAEQEKTGYLSQIESLSKRNTELEDEIRFVNYSKSKEFDAKYQQPYNAACARAAAEVSEIPITDPSTGVARSATLEDVMQLVNMPLGQALQTAKAVFGEYSDYVMNHRAKIRELWDQQVSALEDARKNGAKRVQERQQKIKAAVEKLKQDITRTWEKANQEAKSHERYGKFFQPIEGDSEHNQRLAKGFALVDRAFGEDPRNPKLTPQERAEVVKRHAAVRNRAAAFGPLVQRVEKLEAQLKAASEELKKYKGSTPTTGTPQGATTPGAAPVSGWSGLRAGLQRIAHS